MTPRPPRLPSLWWRVPNTPDDWFSADELDRARRYRRPVARARILRLAISTVALLVIVFAEVAPELVDALGVDNWVLQLLVIVAFLEVGETKIELVQPCSATTGVARFLEKKGEGFHHVCFETPDVDATLADLAAMGVEIIDEQARKGAEGPVAFIHPRSCNGVLTELIGAPGGPAWDRLGYEGDPLAR